MRLILINPRGVSHAPKLKESNLPWFAPQSPTSHRARFGCAILRCHVSATYAVPFINKPRYALRQPIVAVGAARKAPRVLSLPPLSCCSSLEATPEHKRAPSGQTPFYARKRWVGFRNYDKGSGAPEPELATAREDPLPTTAIILLRQRARRAGRECSSPYRLGILHLCLGDGTTGLEPTSWRAFR